MALSSLVERRQYTCDGRQLKGIFAVETIDAGQRVWWSEFGSKSWTMYTRAQIMAHPDREQLVKSSFMIDDDQYVCEVNGLTPACFNHSCDPNVAFLGDYSLVTIRKVTKGEQLKYDYATSETEASLHYGMRCVCGSARCRKVLTFGEWRAVPFMQRYRGCFVEHIQRKHAVTGWHDPRVERRRVAWSEGQYGLFCCSRRGIMAGERIMYSGGKVVHQDELRFDPNRPFDVMDDRIMTHFHTKIDDNLWLAPLMTEHGMLLEICDYINHSCDGNCGVTDVTVVALRDIQPNEELTTDYALFTLGAIMQFDCMCGSDRCRGRYTSDDWKLPEVQREYAGNFSPPVQRDIDKLNADKAE